MLALRNTQKFSIRALLPASCKNVEIISFFSSSKSKDDDGNDSSDDEKQQKKQPKQKTPENSSETAAQRLNRLLGSMKMQSNDVLSSTDFPSPGDAHRRRKEVLKQDVVNKNVITAAKNIANMLSTDESDKKQTESELLAKLLGRSSEAVTPEADGEERKVAAATKTDKDLNLSELIVGMKIDRRQQSQEPESSRGEYVRRTLASRFKSRSGDAGPRSQRPQRHIKREAESFTGSVNLYGGEPLGIFTKGSPKLLDSPDMLATWATLSERALKLNAAHPPANHFEQMAQWTAQGKVWRFPIDNEQDLLEEANVDFSEHIFLEQHLESWCPNKGPIRHFMELVCVGLSKNPYVTAQEKKEHILWFRDYFEAKKDILKDLMSKDTNADVKSLKA